MQTTCNEREELRRLESEATPLDEHLVVNRYDHGGGRVYRDTLEKGLHPRKGSRDLIADLYGDGSDREYWIAGMLALPALLADADRLEKLEAGLHGLIVAWERMEDLSSSTCAVEARALLEGSDHGE